MTQPLLHKDAKGPSRKYSWNYRAIVGMLNYLTGSTRPDIAMAVHQVARFSNDPKLSHEKAIMRICRYLFGTKEHGIIFKPDKKKGLELFVDAEFAGNWKNADEDNPENCFSRSGYTIKYNNCCVFT